MDTTELSSNWRKLQQTLKSQPAASKQSDLLPDKPGRKLHNGASKHVKRKADHLEATSKNGELKKRKPIPSSRQTFPKRNTSVRPNKMGNYLSGSAGPAAEAKDADRPTNNRQDEANMPKKRAATAGKFVALDCEMVGTTSTTIYSIKSYHGNDFSILARVSIVSYAQEVLYDTYVLPPTGVQVTDYRTKHSGITAWHLNKDNAVSKPRPFEQVQQEVADLLKGRILVGHALSNDLAVLGLSHPKRSIRDTSSYPKYRALAAAIRRDGTSGKGRKPALKMLAANVLGYEIQNDDGRGHDSVEDAKATMALFQREKKGFEDEAVKRYGRAALSVGAAPQQVKTSTAPVADEQDGTDASEDDHVDGEDEDEDEEADEAEIANAENLGVGAKVASKGKKTKKKKKKKGKYRK